MHLLVLALTCWACSGHALRVEKNGGVFNPESITTFQQSQAAGNFGVSYSVKGLATLLLASNPTAAHAAHGKKGRSLAVKRASSKGVGSDAAGLMRRGSDRLLRLRGGDDYDDYLVPTGRTLGERVPKLSLRKLREALETPIRYYRESAPITRSWVSASVLLAVVTSMRMVDTRSICLDARAIWHGEWWRLLTNFLFMGDNLKSIFFWMQLNHFWQCSKMLELIKYRWEPDQFLKLIVGNAGLLCVFKQLFPHNMFLGTPLVLAFFYTYSMCNELQPMNFLGVFMTRCSWLPMLQMLQDWAQTGDVSPNLLGMMSGHTYYYLKELRPRLLLPGDPCLGDIRELLLQGKPITIKSDPESSGVENDAGEESAAEESESDDTQFSDDDIYGTG